MSDWDKRFFNIAHEVASWSKDPSTKVGAVIVKDRKIIGTGYNGFPKNVSDDPSFYENRAEKYRRIIHAEVNAILNSVADVSGAIMYVTRPCCSQCAAIIIQSGIKQVICDYWQDSLEEANRTFIWRLRHSLTSAIDMFESADVVYDLPYSVHEAINYCNKLDYDINNYI